MSKTNKSEPIKPGSNSVGAPRLMKSPKYLNDKASAYFKDVDKNPWIKYEAIKSGDMVGTLVEIPLQRPYTLIGFCIFLGVNSEYFKDFKNALTDSEEDKEFSRVIKAIEDIIRNQKFEGAVVGSFKENIIARDLGMVDKIENNNTNTNTNHNTNETFVKFEVVAPKPVD